jgi:hypothetical protein
MDIMFQVGVTTVEETTIEVTGLKVNASYNFRVTARNDIGHSLPYAPEEPITAGKRISESKFAVLVLCIDLTYFLLLLQLCVVQNVTSLFGCDCRPYRAVLLTALLTSCAKLI